MAMISAKEKIVYSAIIIVLLAILIVSAAKLYERDAEPESVVAQDESHPHPHPLRFRSPDELRAWRVYVASALPSRVLWTVSDVISQRRFDSSGPSASASRFRNRNQERKTHYERASQPPRSTR